MQAVLKLMAILGTQIYHLSTTWIFSGLLICHSRDLADSCGNFSFCCNSFEVVPKI